MSVVKGGLMHLGPKAKTILRPIILESLYNRLEDKTNLTKLFTPVDMAD